MTEVPTSLDVFEAEVASVLAGLESGDADMAWRVRWMHPHFRGRHVRDVAAAALSREDARLLVAREHAFDTWGDVERYCADVSSDGPVRRFELLVDAVVDGAVDTLAHALAEQPALARARSTRRHHATLLHYLGANGVEAHRLRTPANALAVASVLLDAGADVDALADLYDARCTTLGMVVSSHHPADAGLQLDLALRLLDRGAALIGPGSVWQSAILTALIFGYLETARGLASRATIVDSVVELAGLGRLDDVRARVATATPADLHAAFALAAQLGHAEIVDLLLAHGLDPNRFNPEGYHAHATPLHQAVWHGHRDVALRLIDAGARLDLTDAIYDATPRQWAEHAGRHALADDLRRRG